MASETQANGNRTGEYEERQRMSLMDAVNEYLVDLNDGRVLLDTYIFDKSARSNIELEDVIFRFRITFKRIFYLTAPIIFTSEDDGLRKGIEGWFKKEITVRKMNAKKFDNTTGKLIKRGLDLCNTFQEKLRENNLMPIRPCILKPPFDLDIDDIFKEEGAEE